MYVAVTSLFNFTGLTGSKIDAKAQGDSKLAQKNAAKKESPEKRKRAQLQVVSKKKTKFDSEDDDSSGSY